MLRSKRRYPPQEYVKEFKKHKQPHRAQRKFASLFPVSPSKKKKLLPLQQSANTEDFLDFLCVRHTPGLPAGLEMFAEPQAKRNHMLSDDDDDSEDDLPLSSMRAAGNVEKEQTSNANTNGKLATEKEKNKGSVEKKSDALLAKSSASVSSKRTFGEKHDFVEVESICITVSEMENLFKCLSDMGKCHKVVALITPPQGAGTPGYLLDKVEFTFKTKHIHRLKHSLASNFVTLLSIKKQLEKESLPITELPKIGLCELDLALLCDTVNSFNGVEHVNGDQCWKTVADHLCVPRTASRRVKKVEDIYLKYILPYETLPKADKINLRESITKNSVPNESWPVEQAGSKVVSVSSFHKTADSYKSMYCKKDEGWQATVKRFWDIVSKGERHICGVSAEIHTLSELQSIHDSKFKVSWKLQDLVLSDNSALRFLGDVPRLSLPVLMLESVFSTSEWCVEEHGFAIISYLHAGEEKIWYIVPEECTKQFLRLKYEFQSFVTAEEIISSGCKLHRCVQKPGEYVLIQANCYYCSVSTGYTASELVSFAPVNWFASRSLLSFKPKLSNFVITKLLFSCAIEESRKDRKSFYCQFLIPKLEAVAKVLSANIRRLNTAGISNSTCLKFKDSSALTCSKCKCVCYLLRVRVQFDDTSYCIDDAIKMRNLKSSDDEFVIELLYTVEKVQSLIKKLKQPQKKCN